MLFLNCQTKFFCGATGEAERHLFWEGIECHWRYATPTSKTVALCSLPFSPDTVSSTSSLIVFAFGENKQSLSVELNRNQLKFTQKQAKICFKWI